MLPTSVSCEAPVSAAGECLPAYQTPYVVCHVRRSSPSPCHHNAVAVAHASDHAPTGPQEAVAVASRPDSVVQRPIPSPSRSTHRRRHALRAAELCELVSPKRSRLGTRLRSCTYRPSRGRGCSLTTRFGRAASDSVSVRFSFPRLFRVQSVALSVARPSRFPSRASIGSRSLLVPSLVLRLSLPAPPSDPELRSQRRSPFSLQVLQFPHTLWVLVFRAKDPNDILP